MATLYTPPGPLITCSAVVELRSQLESLYSDDILVERTEVDETLVWGQVQMALDQLLFPRFRADRPNPIPLLGTPPRTILKEVIAASTTPTCIRRIYEKLMLSDEVVTIVQDAVWNMLSVLYQHSIIDKGRRKIGKRKVAPETWAVIHGAFKDKQYINRTEFLAMLRELGIKMKRGQLEQTMQGLNGERGHHVSLDAVQELLHERTMHESNHEDDAVLRGRISDCTAAIMLRYPLRVRDVISDPIADAVSLTVYRVISKILLQTPTCDPLTDVIRVFVKKNVSFWMCGVPTSVANVQTKEWFHMTEHSIDSRVDRVLVGENTFVRAKKRYEAKERRGTRYPKTPVPPHNTPAPPEASIRFTSTSARDASVRRDGEMRGAGTPSAAASPTAASRRTSAVLAAAGGGGVANISFDSMSDAPTADINTVLAPRMSAASDAGGEYHGCNTAAGGSGHGGGGPSPPHSSLRYGTCRNTPREFVAGRSHDLREYVDMDHGGVYGEVIERMVEDVDAAVPVDVNILTQPATERRYGDTIGMLRRPPRTLTPRGSVGGAGAGGSAGTPVSSATAAAAATTAADRFSPRVRDTPPAASPGKATRAITGSESAGDDANVASGSPETAFVDSPRGGPLVRGKSTRRRLRFAGEAAGDAGEGPSASATATAATTGTPSTATGGRMSPTAGPLRARSLRKQHGSVVASSEGGESGGGVSLASSGGGGGGKRGGGGAAAAAAAKYSSTTGTFAAELSDLAAQIRAVRDNAKKFKPSSQKQTAAAAGAEGGGGGGGAGTPRTLAAYRQQRRTVAKGRHHFAKAVVENQFGLCANSPYFVKVMADKGIPPAPPTKDRRWSGRLTWVQRVM